MTPASIEHVVRDSDLLLGNTATHSGGCCAEDLQHTSRDYISPIPYSGRTEPGFNVEKYVIGIDGEMKILRGNESTPLSLSVPMGYEFDI